MAARPVRPPVWETPHVSETFGLAIGLGLGLAGCTDGYGYGGVGLGYASDPYYDGYGPGYYGAGYAGYPGGYYGGGFGGSFGWYGDYYYPGTGIYVYDRYRRPYRWNDNQRRYWEGRRGNGRPATNWGGFARGNSPAARDYRQDRREANRDFRQDRRVDRGQLNAGTLTPDQFRGERRDARQDYRQGARQDRREYFQNRAGVRTPDAGAQRPAFTGNRGGGQGFGAPRSGGGDRGGGGRRGR